jgi:flagellar basal-body rod protein FlgF
MDRMLYVAMTGANQVLQTMAVNNSNLANANTTGFRQDLAAFRSMPVFGEGQPSRVYSMAERSGVDFTTGEISSTGRELDITIDGQGWIAVQAPDGSEAYTRAGDLRISMAGILTTGTGAPVLGNGGPIAIPPAEKLEIGSDGTISILPLGETATTLVELDRIRLVNPDVTKLNKGADGLMRLKDGQAAPPDALVRIRAGALEGSNVDTIAALANMIDLARRYELNANMMSAADDNARASTQLLRQE